MKKIYLIIGIVCIYSISPQTAQAQCTTCSAGYVIDSIVQEVRLTGILPFNSTVPFNKFDPSTGILNCVKATATVTTIVEMDLANRDNTSRITYNFRYDRTTSLSGPGGLAATYTTPVRLYGPYDLGQPGVDLDTSVHIGPDTLFNQRVISQTTTNTTAYNGIGTLNFTYFNNGSFLMTTGNDNYRLEIAAISDVTIRVVYYFCPLIVLSSGMRDLNVSRKNKMVDVGWTTDNESVDNRYEIEWSRNGRNFELAAAMPSKGPGTKTYSYTHDLKGNGKGKVYYRVRQFEGRGASRYSAIQYVSFSDEGPMDPGIYPNPVTNQLNVSFSRPQTGRLTAELISLSGQAVMSRSWRAMGMTSTQFTLEKSFASGSYWLRIRNLDSGEQVVKRVMVRQ
ncbi:MAG TPA: choice-of-anchor E domain-containing protein [Chitinophagaceae bacterium]|nr:choice-of-anchor E domain-containing protein [Chitinophagaceae bacterium]